MALTNTTYPTSFMPAYNPIEVCFTSTSTAQTNFRYTFKLYVEDTLVDTWRVLPHPNNNEGKVDVSRALQKYVLERINQADLATSFSFATNLPVRRYRVDTVEYYGATPVEVGETTTGDDCYVWCASFATHDWIDQFNETSPFNTWLMNTTNGTSAKFLTDVTNHYVSINDIGRLYCLSNTPTDVDYVEIKTYDSTGTIIQTCQVANLLTMSTDPARLTAVMAAPGSLNNYVGTFLAGAAPIITSSVATYTVQIFKTGGTAMSEVMNFTIQEPCKFAQYRIHYLNELGGFDAYNFLKKTDYTVKIDRKTYKRDEDFFTGASAIAHVHRLNGSQDYFVKSTDKLKVRTDWIDETTNNNLKQLVESPLTYLEFTNLKGDRDFKHVHITSSNWVENLDSIDKLFKLEVEMMLSQENYRQRR